MRQLLYLVDIVVIALVYFALEAGMNALPLPDRTPDAELCESSSIVMGMTARA